MSLHIPGVGTPRSHVSFYLHGVLISTSRRGALGLRTSATVPAEPGKASRRCVQRATCVHRRVCTCCRSHPSGCCSTPSTAVRQPPRPLPLEKAPPSHPTAFGKTHQYTPQLLGVLTASTEATWSRLLITLGSPLSLLSGLLPFPSSVHSSSSSQNFSCFFFCYPAWRLGSNPCSL